MGITNPSYFGIITFNESESVEISSPRDSEKKITIKQQRGVWRPPERLRKFLPEDYHFPFDCCIDAKGLRRFYLRCNFEEMIEYGKVGGLAVIQGSRDLDAEKRQSYRKMWLIFAHVRGKGSQSQHGMKEHLMRIFAYSRDLYNRPLGRLGNGEWDVLPDDVGLTASGEGHRWSIRELTDRGREAAVGAGYKNPTNSHAIAFGLYEAARLNPANIEAEKIPQLVRMALFNIAASESKPNAELLENVKERLLAAIERHHEESTEEFEQWFLGSNNTLVQQIAKQKSQPGGRLKRADVRQALLELGWQAYEYVGQCLHALMQTIKNAIPEPLTAEECRHFEHMYERQLYYGNLPLALLAERMSFLRPAILAIWDDPQDKNHVRVLHRLLQYYAKMADTRHLADRQSKKKCLQIEDKPLQPAAAADDSVASGDTDASVNQVDDCNELASAHRHKTTVGGCHVEFIDDLHSSTKPASDDFKKLAEHIRELCGFECSQACGKWDYRAENSSKDEVALSIRCLCGQVQKIFRMPIEEFKKLAREILELKSGIV